MKKFALLLTLAAAGATAAHAQAPTGMRLGVRVGGTLANIGGKDADKVQGVSITQDRDYKLGYNAGLSLQIPLSADGFWTLAPELLYNRKGFDRDYQITNQNTLASNNFPSDVTKYEFQEKRVLSYIDLPIPVRINTAPGGSGLYFELGPQVGYMVTSERKAKETTKYQDSSKDKNATPTNRAKEDLQSFDIGGVAGLGYQTAGGFSVGVRYNQGFKSLLDDQKAFNRSFTAQVGYLLPFMK